MHQRGRPCPCHHNVHSSYSGTGSFLLSPRTTPNHQSQAPSCQPAQAQPAGKLRSQLVLVLMPRQRLSARPCSGASGALGLYRCATCMLLPCFTGLVGHLAVGWALLWLPGGMSELASAVMCCAVLRLVGCSCWTCIGVSTTTELLLLQVEAEVLGQTGRFTEALSCSVQSSSSELEVASGPAAGSQVSAARLSITSAGIFPAVRAAACPARLQPLVALFPRRSQGPSSQPVAFTLEAEAAEQGQAPAPQRSRVQPAEQPRPFALSVAGHTFDQPQQQQPAEASQPAVPEQPPAGGVDWRCSLSGASQWLLQLVDEAGFCLAGLQLEGAVAQVGSAGVMAVQASVICQRHASGWSSYDTVGAM